MEIRRMRVDEADEISRIYAASWRTAYRGIVPQKYLDNLNDLRWSPKLADTPQRSYVLLDGERYIGTSCISPARDEKMAGWGEVISLYLYPECSGRGFGRALLGFCVGELQKAGFGRVYLWTLEENARARAFYERFGFSLDGGKITCVIGGKTLAECRYVYEAQTGGV